MNKSFLLAKLNKEIIPYVTRNNYFKSIGESLCGISEVLLNNNIIPQEDLLLQNIDHSNGRKTFRIFENSIFEGQKMNLFLTFVWYRMGSGNYEIVAYFS